MGSEPHQGATEAIAAASAPTVTVPLHLAFMLFLLSKKPLYPNKSHLRSWLRGQDRLFSIRRRERPASR